MELRKEEYSGDIHKKVYVSAEKGRKHIANNPAGQYEVTITKKMNDNIKYVIIK